jgi:trigger factor
MASNRFTLTSYDPVYAVAEEVWIPEEAVRDQAVRWLKFAVCKDGQEPKLTDQWVDAHTDDFKNVDELLIFIRYNMYKDNREAQELADQNVICKELATRLVEELPAALVEQSVYDANARLDEMISRSGTTIEGFCKQRGITKDQLYADIKERTVQSIKEDSALEAYAQHFNFTLDAEDFYAIIPGDNIQDKAHKRKQIELEGRLPQMEEYALKTKALKEIMENAMIKRKATDEEWLRYGDTSVDVLDANKQFPDSFVSL